MVTGETRTLYYFYDEKGDVAGFEYNGSAYFYQKNMQGDVLRVCNEGGDIVAEYTYDAWGKVLSVTDAKGNAITSETHVANLNPFRYRSYYYDTETGFYYLNSRYYDPEVGRFLNADGIVGANGGITGYNMFAYCNNNPVIYFDPSGEADAICLGERSPELVNPGRRRSTGGVIAGVCVIAGGVAVGQILADPIANSIDLAKAKAKAKAEAKEEVIADSSDKSVQTYYHVTTYEAALEIIASGELIGGLYEGGYVYAWLRRPNAYAINNSGAHFGVTIAFKTNAVFVPDPGITDRKVLKFLPVVSAFPGPIKIWDVTIVG